MTVPASHVEAKLHAFRRTKDGVVVSFVLHPQEVPERLAIDDLGTRYMLAFAQIGDDEQPVKPPEKPASEKKGLHPPRPFDSLPRSQQAALACTWPDFQRWMCGGTDDASERVVAGWLREILNINSRAELDAKERIALHTAWDALYIRFKQETGREAEERR